MSRQVQMIHVWIFLIFHGVGYLRLFFLQMDVFNTFIELLRQTGNVTKGQIDINELRRVFILCYFRPKMN